MMYAIYSPDEQGWLHDPDEPYFDEYVNDEYVFDSEADAQEIIEDNNLDAEVVQVTQEEIDALEQAFWSEDEEPDRTVRSLSAGVALEQGSLHEEDKEQALQETINRLYGKTVHVTPASQEQLRLIATHAFSLLNPLPVTYGRPVAGAAQGVLPNSVWTSLDGVVNVYITASRLEQAQEPLVAFLNALYTQNNMNPQARFFIGLHDDITEPPVDGFTVTLQVDSSKNMLELEQALQDATGWQIATRPRRFMDAH